MGKYFSYILLVLYVGILFLQINVETLPLWRILQQCCKIGVIIISANFIVMNFNLIRQEKSLYLIFVFFIYTVIYAFFYSNYFQLIVAPTLVLISGLTFYVIARKCYIHKNTYIVFFLLAIFIALYRFYLSTTSKIINFGGLEGLGGDNVAYSLLMLAPACMFLPKKKALFTFFVIFLTVVFCRKRGATIAGVLIAIFVIKNYFENIRKQFVLLYAIVFFFFIGYGYFYLYTNYYDILFSRFEASGSGREELYSLVWNAWSSSNILFLLFGFGFYSVMDLTNVYLGISLYAHSDIFEILYDYGLVGLLLYFYIFYQLYKSVKRIRSIESVYKAGIMCLIIFIPKAIFSGVIFDIDSMILMAILGLSIGMYKSKQYYFEKSVLNM